MPIEDMSVNMLAERLAGPGVCLLDVREPWEVETASIDGALNVPMADVPDNLEQLREASRDLDVVVMCHSGRRSRVIAGFLNQAGFQRVFNLVGGIDAWSQQIDPTVPTY